MVSVVGFELVQDGPMVYFVRFDTSSLASLL